MIKGKHPTLLPRKPTANEIIESLIRDGKLEHIKRNGERLFKFKDRRRLYSADELVKLLRSTQK